MVSVRGLRAALNGNKKFKYKAPESAVDYLVIGGGVVGLAIAQRLSHRFPRRSTFLVERHSRAGEEISSRNSEVIHSGLYYPSDSLKTRLCLRGRELLYQRCIRDNIPHRKTGKLVVAHEHQRAYIENLHSKAQSLKWPKYSRPLYSDTQNVLPTELISGDQARALEPNLSKFIVAALWSPETGIVDSHTLMESFEKDVSESESGQLVYSTRVVRVDPYRPSSQASDTPEINTTTGWVVQTVTGDAEESDALMAHTLINASGLSGPLVLNSLLPKELQIPIYYARGSYASYKGPGVAGISRLIYPCPDAQNHNFHSLGSHLTLDLDAKIRFGPDLEWISPPTDGSEADIDFWQQHLVPNDSMLEEMHVAVTSYLPEVRLEGLQADYVGIRPKLVSPAGGFQDFTFRVDYSGDFTGMGGNGKGPMISLLGIESPGLTSALAIAELVVEDMLMG